LRLVLGSHERLSFVLRIIGCLYYDRNVRNLSQIMETRDSGRFRSSTICGRLLQEKRVFSIAA
jgi:hypothetical protein